MVTSTRKKEGKGKEGGSQPQAEQVYHFSLQSRFAAVMLCGSCAFLHSLRDDFKTSTRTINGTWRDGSGIKNISCFSKEHNFRAQHIASPDLYNWTCVASITPNQALHTTTNMLTIFKHDKNSYFQKITKCSSNGYTSHIILYDLVSICFEASHLML